MPESNKGARARQLKANRAAGIGDETGRLPPRTKAEAIMLTCSICKVELKATKTNTELKQHSMGKHGKADVEECFPGAEMAAKGIMERLAGKGGGGKGAGGGGISKAEKKKKAAAGMDDLLSAGLSAGAGKKKGGKKR